MTRIAVVRKGVGGTRQGGKGEPRRSLMRRELEFYANGGGIMKKLVSGTALLAGLVVLAIATTALATPIVGVQGTNLV